RVRYRHGRGNQGAHIGIHVVLVLQAAKCLGGCCCHGGRVGSLRSQVANRPVARLTRTRASAPGPGSKLVVCRSLKHRYESNIGSTRECVKRMECSCMECSKNAIHDMGPTPSDSGGS